MQNGIFILDGTPTFNSTVGVKTNSIKTFGFNAFPNPASDILSINYITNNSSKIELKNALGQLVYEKQFSGNIYEQIDLKSFDNGCYLLLHTEQGETTNKKVMINH